MPSWALVLSALSLSLGAALSRQYSLKPIGCYIDNTGGARDLNGLKDLGYRRIGNVTNSQVAISAADQSASIGSGSISNEFCGSICSAGGFRFMGLQSGWWCFCGNSYGSQGAASIGNCSSTCSGNSAQNCGGPNRNYVLQLSYAYDRTRFVPGNRDLFNLTRADALTLRVDRMAECVYLCRTHRTGCQAVVFSQQRGLCHLLEFAAVPDDLKSADSGDFYVWA